MSQHGELPSPREASSQGRTQSGQSQQPQQIQTQVETGMDVPGTYRSSSHRPTIALSLRLIDTYKEINRIYYEARNKRATEETPRNGAFNDGYDDENYDYIVRENELFANRYNLHGRIGKGSFGQVVSAYDNRDKCEVAIKIIKSKRAFYNQAQTEKELLQLISRSEGSSTHNLVRITFV